MLFKKCMNLTRLRIDTCSGCVSDAFLEALSESNVTHLGLGFGDNTLLKYVGKMKELTSLRIYSDAVTLAGIKNIKNKKLIHLDIRRVDHDFLADIEQRL